MLVTIDSFEYEFRKHKTGNPVELDREHISTLLLRLRLLAPGLWR
jgi:hypothetical protein